MIANIHISQAIADYQKIGRDFHEVMLWHLLHGLLMITPDFLCIGYHCRDSDLATPVPPHSANTVFVTYMTGCMDTLKSMAPTIPFIAFQRGFTGRTRTYGMDQFKNHIN